jgi:ribosomal protein S18 acetylase RimI-like enzyme
MSAALSSQEATRLAMAADVYCHAEDDAEWLAQCMTIERKAFAKHEAMDIPYEIDRVSGTTLLCASPSRLWSGPAFGGSFGPEACVGYAVVQDRQQQSGNEDEAQGTTVSISKLTVAQSLRRRGIGHALLAAAIDHARARRARRCALHVDAENSNAQRLYESFGFSIHGERLDHFYRPGRHAFEMLLWLQRHEGPADGDITPPLDPPPNSCWSRRCH